MENRKDDIVDDAIIADPHEHEATSKEALFDTPASHCTKKSPGSKAVKKRFNQIACLCAHATKQMILLVMQRYTPTYQSMCYLLQDERTRWDRIENTLRRISIHERENVYTAVLLEIMKKRMEPRIPFRTSNTSLFFDAREAYKEGKTWKDFITIPVKWMNMKEGTTMEMLEENVRNNLCKISSMCEKVPLHSVHSGSPDWILPKCVPKTSETAFEAAARCLHEKAGISVANLDPNSPMKKAESQSSMGGSSSSICEPWDVVDDDDDDDDTGAMKASGMEKKNEENPSPFWMGDSESLVHCQVTENFAHHAGDESWELDNEVTEMARWFTFSEVASLIHGGFGSSLSRIDPSVEIEQLFAKKSSFRPRVEGFPSAHRIF
eukprot:TRINITY_DN45976_c0_g1_i1.p1 TRINITY_DN45976_c0_g1~~TRINITY_DN45976_c0_g1_i1.p1  ORF type:complete len:379 (-),score=113.87 TRINITY_DN45976_c0_g1_i1:138-1274(-)